MSRREYYYTVRGLGVIIGMAAFFWLAILNARALPYLPGETLDPTCAPTTTNCTVIPPAQAGFNVDIYRLAPTGSLLLTPGSGRVGINTTNPLETLDVNGAIRIGSTSQTLFGTVRWTGSDFEGYGLSGWTSLTSGVSPSSSSVAGNLHVLGITTSSVLFANTSTITSLLSQNFFATSALFSAATTTHLSATLASLSSILAGSMTSTNVYATSLVGSQATLNNLLFTNASGTSLYIAGPALFVGTSTLATTSIVELTVSGTSTLATTSADSLIVSGNQTIGGGLVVGGAVSSTLLSAATGTFGSATVTGTLTTAYLVWTAATGTDLYTTNGTSSQFFATNLSGTNGSVSNLLMVQGTSTNFSATHLTATNGVITNATSTQLAATVAAVGSLVAGNATTTNLYVTELATTGIVSGTVTTTNLFGTNAQFGTVTATAFSSAAASLTQALLGSATSTNLVAGLFAATTGTVSSLTFGSGVGGSLIISGALVGQGFTTFTTTTIADLTVTGSTTLTNAVISQLSASTGTIGFLSATSVGAQSVSTTALSASTVAATTGTFTNLVVTNPPTFSNIVWVSATGTNLFLTSGTSTNFFATNLTGTNGSVTNLLAVSATSTNLNATNLTAANGTFTAATTTNLAATVGSLTSATIGAVTSTNVVVTNLVANQGLITNVTTTNAVVNNATTTNLFASVASVTSALLSAATSTNFMVSNLVVTTGTANNLVFTSASGANLSLTGVVTFLGSTQLATTSITSLTVSGTSTLSGLAAQTITATSGVFLNGVVLSSSTPPTTTNALYNIGGQLYFNGSAVGGGSHFTNLTWGSATGTNLVVTNATATNILATNINAAAVTGTSLFASSLAATTGTISALFFGNATGTNLYVSNGFASAGTSTLATTTVTSLTVSGTSTLANVSIGNFSVATATFSAVTTTNLAATIGTLSGLVVGNATATILNATNFTVTTATTTGNQYIGGAATIAGALAVSGVSSLATTTVTSLTASATSSLADVLISGYAVVGAATRSTTFALEVNGDIGPRSSPTRVSSTQSALAIDSTGSVGQHASVRIGGDGLPIIAYYDATNLDLKYIKCTNANCSTRFTQILDATGDVGQYASLRLFDDGSMGIAYFDATNSDVKFLSCTSVTNCAGTATIRTIETTGNVGQFVSLAIGSDGSPVLSYFDASGNDLKVAKCNDATCAGVTVTSVDTAGTVGQYTSITINSDGTPFIAYYAQGTGDLKVVKCGNKSCSAGNTITSVETTNNIGQFTSVAVGPDGLPIIAHYSVTGLDLRVVKCSNIACTARTITAVDTTGSVGQYTSIAFGPEGFALISYYDATNGNVKTVSCGNAACSSGNVITAVESTNDVGQFTSVAFGAQGLPVLAFYDVTNLDLRLLFCGSKSCASNDGSYQSGANLGSRDKFFNNVYAANYWAREGIQVANFDLAESYLIQDESIEPGDVVRASTGTPYTIEKTTGKYDQAVGVISTKPGIVLSDWITKSVNADATRAVALAGRVPVKVSGENGAVVLGDLLAPSSLPGVAMKACGSTYCEPAFVIGVALESFSATDPQQIGAVMMMANTQWYVPNASALSERSATSSTTTVPVYAADLMATAAPAASLSPDQAGYATIRSGETSVDVVFAAPFTVNPVITVTLATDVTLQKSFITAMSKRGFRIVVAPQVPMDTLFTWHALGVAQPVNFYGNTERSRYELPRGEAENYANYYGHVTGVVAGGREAQVRPVNEILLTDTPYATVTTSLPVTSNTTAVVPTSTESLQGVGGENVPGSLSTSSIEINTTTAPTGSSTDVPVVPEPLASPSGTTATGESGAAVPSVSVEMPSNNAAPTNESPASSSLSNSP